MEASFPVSGTFNSRKKKKKRAKKKVLNKTPFLSYGVARQIAKSVSGRITISGRCVNSFVRGLYERTSDLGKETNFLQYERRETNLVVEHTIDLCDNDYVDEGCHSSEVINLPSQDGEPQKGVVEIDLDDDVSKQEEIIDLTDSDSVSLNDCRTGPTECQLGPTIIDISDGIAKGANEDNKSDNDGEVFVIGTFSRNCATRHRPLPGRLKSFNSLVACTEKLKKKYVQDHSAFGKIIIPKKKPNQEVFLHAQQSSAKVGENVYVDSPRILPSTGLRPIIIDGSNVAFVHSTCNFSCKRLEICINYFKEKGHKVTAFVPQFRLNSRRSDDPNLLRKLEKKGDVVLTPSKKIDGRNIVPYDDRFIVQTAVLQGGIIVTRDNYNDLLKENPSWAETIKYRTLAFTWVDDILMFPNDPLGEYGPRLDEFLRFH